MHYGLSAFDGGIVAFSRILSDREVVVAANTGAAERWSGEVVVDSGLNPADTEFTVLFGNRAAPAPPGRVAARGTGTVDVVEVDGSTGAGPLHTVRVTLEPLEAQIIGRR